MSHRRDDRVVSLLPRPPLAGDVGARLPYTLTHLCISASLHLCIYVWIYVYVSVQRTSWVQSAMRAGIGQCLFL